MLLNARTLVGHTVVLVVVTAGCLLNCLTNIGFFAVT